jgi:Snf7
MADIMVRWTLCEDVRYWKPAATPGCAHRAPAVRSPATRAQSPAAERMFVLPQDMHNDIQDVLGQNYGVPDDVDEDELLGELDALEADMAFEAEETAAQGAVPSYLQARPRAHTPAVLPLHPSCRGALSL